MQIALVWTTFPCEFWDKRRKKSFSLHFSLLENILRIINSKQFEKKKQRSHKSQVTKENKVTNGQNNWKENILKKVPRKDRIVDVEILRRYLSFHEYRYSNGIRIRHLERKDKRKYVYLSKCKYSIIGILLFVAMAW